MIKLHTIDSQMNYLKNKAIAFGRNLHLLVSKPSVSCAEAASSVLDLQSQPSLLHAAASWSLIESIEDKE